MSVIRVAKCRSRNCQSYQCFPITKRWPPRNPKAIQLYSLTTPNGVKASIALEEMGIPYDAHLVSFSTDDQMTPEFLSLNPNNKIPAIIDPDGPGGKPIPLFECGAILLYLAEKSGSCCPPTRPGAGQIIQWLMFQMGGVGPMFGQVGFFHHFAGKDIAIRVRATVTMARPSGCWALWIGSLRERLDHGQLFHRRYRHRTLAAHLARLSIARVMPLAG